MCQLASKDDLPRAEHACVREDRTREAERAREAVETTHDAEGLHSSLPSNCLPGSLRRTLEDGVAVAAKRESFRGDLTRDD